jgi:hypothetical protein
VEHRLFPPVAGLLAESRPLPVWEDIHRERKRKGVTLFLLWQEYKAIYPEQFLLLVR